MTLCASLDKEQNFQALHLRPWRGSPCLSLQLLKECAPCSLSMPASALRGEREWVLGILILICQFLAQFHPLMGARRMSVDQINTELPKPQPDGT